MKGEQGLGEKVKMGLEDKGEYGLREKKKQG